jgi:UDP-N-acetylmuramoyl-tripeptide--D-alanyl-D-alanine ligase
MNLETNLLILAMSLTLWPRMKHALHMFQQNRYEHPRYIPWVLQSKTTWSLFFSSLLMGIAIVLSVLIQVPYASIAIYLGLALVYQIFKSQTKFVKPLVITARVSRQILVFYVLVLLILFSISLISVDTDFNHIILGLTLLIMHVLIHFMMMIVGYLTAPLEKVVHHYFMKITRQILKKNTRLVKIGITGSYGKTTSKNIMNEVLSSSFYTLMTPASYNTPMGITKTVRELLKPIHQVFVCEMGADKMNDIHVLMGMVKPQFGIVTEVGPQHLDTFKTQENILKEKMKMIEELPSSGCGFINYDNEFIRSYHIKNKVPIVKIGIEHPDCDYRAQNIVVTSLGCQFEVVTKEGVVIPLETKLLGRHNVMNILFSVAVARYLQIDWDVISKSIKALKPVSHRLEPKMMFGLHVIDNAYNSNPKSAMHSLEVLKMMPGVRYLITPGMVELGDKTDEYNEAFGANMINHVDEVILIGKNRSLPIQKGLMNSGFDMDHVHVVNSTKEAFDFIKKKATPQDSILIENDLPDAFIH